MIAGLVIAIGTSAGGVTLESAAGPIQLAHFVAPRHTSAPDTLRATPR